jgi:hypothetical protein
MPFAQVFIRESVSLEVRQAAREALRLRKAATLASETSMGAINSPMHVTSSSMQSGRRTVKACRVVARAVESLPGLRSTVAVWFCCF